MTQRSAPDQEVEFLNIEELAESFSLERINKNPTVIDETTLLWINRLCHKRRLSSERQLNDMAIQLQSEVSRMFK